MNKNRTFFLWIFLCGIILTYASCFEIIEEVNMNNDGTGSFNLTINMSQSKTEINSMLLLDSVNGKPVPKTEDMKQALKKVEDKLKTDTSLHNIIVKANWDDYIFSVSGSFDNVDALNKAIKNINSSFTKQHGYEPQLQNNFKYVNKTFERFYNYNLMDGFNKLSQKDRSAFEKATYTTIYRFKSLIVNHSNNYARKSKSGRAMMLKTNIKDLVTRKSTIENTIRLR